MAGLEARKQLRLTSIHRRLCGGWRIPSGQQQQGGSVERVPVPGEDEALEIRLKQRFTVTPGSCPSDDLTGTRVWPTARSLLEKFLRSHLLCHEKRRILELGSGCGLLGMALAATGKEVVLTDYAGNIKWLRQNLELNTNILGNRATSAELLWGDEETMSALEKTARPFHAILASDVIYDPNSHQALVKTMCRFALPNRAPVYLGYPKRNSNDEAFFQTVSEHFDVEFEPLDSEEKTMLAVCHIRNDG
jgi:predicted nicotinamide N-methyase